MDFGESGDPANGKYWISLDTGTFTANREVQYYLSGTPTPVAVGGAMTSGSATWTGSYEGQYRVHPVDAPANRGNTADWGELADDSGTAEIAVDFGTFTHGVTVTLTSSVGNTFPTEG